MAEFPALPLWTDAYLADTVHMSNRESGAYLHLLMASWRIADGGLPNDHRLLARYARCSKPEWDRVKGAVMAFWTLGEDYKFRQKRLEKEKVFVRGKREQASAAANAKWLKEKGRGHAVAQNGHLPNGVSAYPPTPTPIKKEEIGLEGRKKFHVKIDSPQWVAWKKYNGKTPPYDKDGGWWFESEWPPGMDPEARGTNPRPPQAPAKPIIENKPLEESGLPF